MRQVAGRRVAGFAFSGAVEINLAGLGITRHDVQSFVGSAVCDDFHLQMEEFRDVAQLVARLTQRKAGIPCEGLPSWTVCLDEFALVVVQYHRGAQQVGSARAATRIRPVTEAAVRARKSWSPRRPSWRRASGPSQGTLACESLSSLPAPGSRLVRSWLARLAALVRGPPLQGPGTQPRLNRPFSAREQLRSRA